MSETKHTPGPWQSHYAFDVTGYPCFFIHGMSGEQKHNAVVLEANTKLIAAAPDLLAACKAMVMKAGGSKHCEGYMLKSVVDAETAISKAED